MANPAQEAALTAADVYYGIGENVKTLLDRRQMLRKDLGPVLGISESAVSLKLNGHSPWTAYEVVVVSELFDAPVGVIYGTEPMPRPVAPVRASGGALGRRNLYLLDIPGDETCRLTAGCSAIELPRITDTGYPEDEPDTNSGDVIHVDFARRQIIEVAS